MPKLDIRLIPQWGVGASRKINDCGPASVAMCLGYYGQLGSLTVDQLALETGLIKSDVGLMPDALVKLAARHNLATFLKVGATEGDLRDEINTGRPVILLFAYRFILGRLDQADDTPGSDGHFAVLTGYDDTHFLINDPDVWIPYVERGHDMLIPVTQLSRAMAEYHGQAVFMGENMSLSELIAAEADKMKTWAAEIARLEQAQNVPPVTPTPVVDPIPGTVEEAVIRAGVNVRSATIVDGNTPIDGLKVGQRVKFQGAKAASGHIWSSLLSVDGVARTYHDGDKIIYGVFARDVAFPNL